jgi:hypothetical protein
VYAAVVGGLCLSTFFAGSGVFCILLLSYVWKKALQVCCDAVVGGFTSDVQAWRPHIMVQFEDVVNTNAIYDYTSKHHIVQ